MFDTYSADPNYKCLAGHDMIRTLGMGSIL